MTNSPSAMPRAFNLSNPVRDAGSAPHLSGAKSHIFQPPRTHSASSSLILTHSSASVASVHVRENISKKRTRSEYHEVFETPRQGKASSTDNEDCVMGDSTAREGWIPDSPTPFVNTRYQLAGGMDTPSLLAAQAAEVSEDMDAAYRRSLVDVARPPGMGVELFGEPDLLESLSDGATGRDCNGSGRYGRLDLSPGGDGWSKAAIQVVGAVAGKAWEFCKSSAAVFRGFQAGGGIGYKLNTLDKARPHFDAIEGDFWQDTLNKNSGCGEAAPLPGQYPVESFDITPRYFDHPTPENTPPRSSKRRQVSASNSNNNNDELAKNWVVVRPSTPTPTPTKYRPTVPARYSMPTVSSSRRTTPSNTPHRQASRVHLGAPMRRLGLTSPVSRVSHAGSPGLNPAQRASFASPRNSAGHSRIPRATITANAGSPLRQHNSALIPQSPVALEAKREAQKWAEIRKREEKEQDESIDRMDAQLTALVREAKEALGTTIEIAMDNQLDTSPQPAANSRRGKWGFI